MPVPELPKHSRQGIFVFFPPKERRMKISGRNFIPGTVVEVKEGATTAHVRVEIAGGSILTASITNEAVEDLGLKKGAKVHALIKASDVMIAVGD
jgi:molybdopterin-binding protein